MSLLTSFTSYIITLIEGLFKFLHGTIVLFLSQVARKIKLSGNQLCLLVLDGEEYERVLFQGQDLDVVASASKGGGWKPPRICHITKDPVSGLGINFTPVEGTNNSLVHRSRPDMYQEGIKLKLLLLCRRERSLLGESG